MQYDAYIFLGPIGLVICKTLRQLLLLSVLAPRLQLWLLESVFLKPVPPCHSQTLYPNSSSLEHAATCYNATSLPECSTKTPIRRGSVSGLASVPTTYNLQLGQSCAASSSHLVSRSLSRASVSVLPLREGSGAQPLLFSPQYATPSWLVAYADRDAYCGSANSICLHS